MVQVTKTKPSRDSAEFGNLIRGIHKGTEKKRSYSNDNFKKGFLIKET